MRKPTIAITGAGGFIGTQMVRHFAEMGWQVIALVRRPKRSHEKNVTYKAYNLEATPARELLENVDYLIHAAYIKNDPAHPDAYDKNIKGTTKLLSVSTRCGVKKNILFSSMSARPDALSVYGKQKYELEKMFQGTRDAIIRPGLVIGDGGLVKEMSHFMRSKHVVPLVGGGTQPLQVIDVPSLIAAIEQILQKDLSGTYTVASSKAYTYKTFYQALASTLHTRVVFVPTPYPLLLFVLGLLKKLKISVGITQDNVLGLKTLQRIDTTADLKILNLTIPSLQKMLRAVVDKKVSHA